MNGSMLPIALAVLLSLAACGPPEPRPEPEATTPRLRLLDSPAGPAAGQPRLHDGADGRTYLSWVEARAGGHVLLFATLTDRRWSAPREIASGRDWFVNWADVPSLCALADGGLAAHWLERMGEGTYAYGVRVAVSPDGGANWNAPRWLHEDETPTEHGFASIVALDGERFAATWLDGNALESRGEMELRGRTFDLRGAFGDEQVIDSRVCECCATSAVALGGGSSFVVHRDRGAEDIRDIFGSRLEEGVWSSPARIHEDRWKMPG